MSININDNVKITQDFEALKDKSFKVSSTIGPGMKIKFDQKS